MLVGQREHLWFLQSSKWRQEGDDSTMLNVEQQLPGAQPLAGAIWIGRPRMHTDRNRPPGHACPCSRHEEIVSGRYLPFSRNH
jgi:hypothetical protein